MMLMERTNRDVPLGAALLKASEAYLDEEEQDLLRRAKPNVYADAFFNHHIRIAVARGMTRVQALRYVAEKRVENGSAVIACLEDSGWYGAGGKKRACHQLI